MNGAHRGGGMVSVVLAAVVSFGGSGITATSAQTLGPAPGDLPHATFSSRTWHVGDRVAVSGTRCNDPKTPATPVSGAPTSTG